MRPNDGPLCEVMLFQLAGQVRSRVKCRPQCGVVVSAQLNIYHAICLSVHELKVFINSTVSCHFIVVLKQFLSKLNYCLCTHYLN